jgi:four helix bundle protein
MAQSYRDLQVWKKSMELVTFAYQVSQKFPKEEVYGLTSQVRRSAVSIPSNIAEGKGRRTAAEFQHFLIQARGSLFELETQVEISGNLGYITAGQLEEINLKTTQLAKMLNSLIDVVKGQK